MMPKTMARMVGRGLDLAALAGLAANIRSRCLAGDR